MVEAIRAGKVAVIDGEPRIRSLWASAGSDRKPRLADIFAA